MGVDTFVDKRNTQVNHRTVVRFELGRFSFSCRRGFNKEEKNAIIDGGTRLVGPNFGLSRN